MKNSFGSLSTLEMGGRAVRMHRLDALAPRFDLARLPYALRILLECLLRTEDGSTVTAGDVEALAGSDPRRPPQREIAFVPGRVLMQDFTGVPAIVDLAAMREAMGRMGGDPRRINPLQPVELVIDHSVQVDAFGTPDAFAVNAAREFERNRERYEFLKWGQEAFANFRVVPPDTGIVHQVNLEFLARVVMTAETRGEPPMAFPDTVVGTDSHTTMINGLGVLGWGVGGIEAEAAMLGQPVSMLIPEVVGVRMEGRLREGTTATDLVLRVTELLRKKGVVGKLVEFFGPGSAGLPLADRATIANMAPEYGATCGLFPVDAETLRYLELTGRSREQRALVEAYCRAQGLWRDASTPEAVYADVVGLDLATIEPSLAGPRRPQDRVALGGVKASFAGELPAMLVGAKAKNAQAAAAAMSGESASVAGAKPSGVPIVADGAQAAVPAGTEPHVQHVPAGDRTIVLDHGSVVIAAITSCTNTSNPSVLVGAGLLAKRAVERFGLRAKPWVKTSLAPGSKVVTEYLRAAGLLPYLEQLGFHLVGYGCTTCIGNSGPLPPAISRAIDDGNLVVAAVLSGNRNFEGRIHAQVRANYLASPPLVVAYAIAGRVDVDLTSEPLGVGRDGEPVFLRDVWPSQREIDDAVRTALRAEMFAKSYADVFAGDDAWRGLRVPKRDTYAWDATSTYVKSPPYFVDMPKEPAPIAPLTRLRCLALFGDSITTDHISPAGSIKKDSPAGQYLVSHGVEPEEFNSYGARRGNHEVMVRGTFANVRLRNLLVPGVEGGVTVHFPDGATIPIYDAAMRYREEDVPLAVVAGKEYGSGSSRDWAAKGPRLLGVRVVLAESFERIHRSNLVGMGILPLEFRPGESAATHELSGRELLDVTGLAALVERGACRGEVTVRARGAGSERSFAAIARIDTPRELQYFRHGGILPFVLRQLLDDRATR